MADDEDEVAFFDDDIEKASMSDEELQAIEKKKLKPAYMCGGSVRKPPVCDFGSDNRWLGCCPKCHRLYAIVSGRTKNESKGRISLSTAKDVKPRVFISTGITEFDLVLAQDFTSPTPKGGLVPGSVILIGGERGVGKSTILMQTASGVAKAGRKNNEKPGKYRVVYSSGEQNKDDLLQVAARLGINDEEIEIMGDNGNIYEIISACEQIKPRLLIIDSLQTAYCDDCESDIGQIAAMDAVCAYVTSFAKATKVAVIIVSHLNKDNDYAGSEKVQHWVDELIRIEHRPLTNDRGEIDEETRNYIEISIDGKNRNGSADATGMLQMTPTGLKSIDRRKSSKLILDIDD